MNDMLNWSGCQACHDGGQQANSWVADHKKATTLKTSISPSHFQAKFNLKTHYTKRKEREKKIVISGFIFLSVAFFSTVRVGGSSSFLHEAFYKYYQ